MTVKRRRASPGRLIARRFLRWLRSSSREEIERELGPMRRRIVLSAIFRQIPKRLDRDAAAGVEAVVDWRIGGRRDEGVDYYQLVIADGRGSVTRRPKRRPDLTLELDLAPFLQLISGAANGPDLFMRGYLKLDGDPTVAMNLQRLFRVPRT